MLLILLFSLSACSQESAKTLEKIETYYQSLEAFTARVNAQVELADRVQNYVLDWEFSHGAYRITIVEPEVLAGISISGAENEGITLEYDSLTLAVDADGSVISPLESLTLALEDWRGCVAQEYGYTLCQDKNALAVTYSRQHNGYQLSQQVWFDPESCAPQAVEIYADGALVTEFEFLLFQVQ